MTDPGAMGTVAMAAKEEVRASTKAINAHGKPLVQKGPTKASVFPSCVRVWQWLELCRTKLLGSKMPL